MTIHHLRLLRHFTLLLISFLLLAGRTFPALASSSSPGWNSAPSRLKQAPGVVEQDGWIYATALETVSPGSYRQDKANEIAMKKALASAIRMAGMAAVCGQLTASLEQDQIQDFFLLLAPALPPLRLERMTVLRQWEIGYGQYAMCAVPLSSAAGVVCPFPDLPSAISAYLQSNALSLDGLSFSLGLTPRHSRLASSIRARMGELLAGTGLKCSVTCPSGGRRGSGYGGEIFKLALIQQRRIQAESMVMQARKAGEKGRWTQALDLASRAISVYPACSSAYLLIAEHFMKEGRYPMAVPFLERALAVPGQDQKALKLLVSCLEGCNSPEAELYRLILSRTGRRRSVPDQWSKEATRLSDMGAQVSRLVLLSAGNALEGPAVQADQDFKKAITAYSQATGDEDVALVLDKLLVSRDRYPYCAEAYNLIGACYRNLGRPFLAIPFLLQALRLRPGYDMALVNLGICCKELGLKGATRYYFSHPEVAGSANKWVVKWHRRVMDGGLD
ncbi:tetratricopeptide repeat protein [Dissulfuribacter thermophilus]|nr:tetratricopeptide repeat protein [Dissulfuribacter thermophilus]